MIINFFNKLSNMIVQEHPNPFTDCVKYKDKGCELVDGPKCDIVVCTHLTNYIKEKTQSPINVSDVKERHYIDFKELSLKEKEE